MSLPATAKRTWTRKELEALKRKDIMKEAKVCLLPPFLIFSYAPRDLPRYRTSPTLVDTFSSSTAFWAQGQCENCRHRRKNPGIVCLQLQLLSFRRSLDSSSRQQSKHADAVPPEPSPELLLELSPELSPEPPPVVCNDPPEAGSLGSNPSQESASSHHLSLGTNNSPHKDKGNGNATETADAEPLKGSSGEFSGSHTSRLPHATSIMTASSERKKKRRPKGPTRLPHGGESSLPQNSEPNQNNDSQERLQGMMARLVRVFGADDLCFGFQFNRSLFPTTVVPL